MSGYSTQEVSQRAGVDLEYVERLVELGILAPGEDGAFSAGDARRARLVHGLEEAGVPLGGIAAAVGDQKLSLAFLDVSSFERFSGLSETTFRQLSAGTGIPLDLLMVVRQAVGFAQPSPDDHVREDELRICSVIELQLSKGFRPAAIERWLRVHGDSLRRIAETEAEAWHTEVELPLVESGLTAGEMLDATDELTLEMPPLLESALLAIYHGQQEHAWTRRIVEGVEEALEGAGLHRRLEQQPAICFLDITGYTRLTEERGDVAAAELAAALARRVERVSREHHGKPVKWLGDGVMILFEDAAGAVMASLEMVEGIERDGLPPAHVGIDTGPVVFQEGDYFGRTVNLAARIAERARPGEVLVSRGVIDAVGAVPVSFIGIGAVELKGVAGATPLHSAHRNV